MKAIEDDDDVIDDDGIAQCLEASSGKVKVVVPVFLALLLLAKIAPKFNLIDGGPPPLFVATYDCDQIQLT